MTFSSPTQPPVVVDPAALQSVPPQTVSPQSAARIRFLESSLADWQVRWGHDPVEGHVWLEGVLQPIETAIERGALVSHDRTDELGCSWQVAPGWRFSGEGLEPISAAHWETLQPCEQREADGNWYVEVLATAENLNHGHLRLIDAEGRLISVGFSGDCSFPYSWKRGEIRCPDQREVLNRDHRVVRIQLSQEQYASIKGYIETAQREQRLAFQVQERNCTVFVAECLEQVGIHINHKEFMTQAVARAALRCLGWRPPMMLLRLAALAACVIRFLLTPLWVTLWLSSGAGRVSAPAREAYASTFATRESWSQRCKRIAWAILTVSYMKFYTGWKLGVWLDELQAHRSERTYVTVEEAQLLHLPSTVAMSRPGSPGALHQALDQPERSQGWEIDFRLPEQRAAERSRIYQPLRFGEFEIDCRSLEQRAALSVMR